MMRLDELFDIRYGHSLTLSKLKQTTGERGVPFVSRKTTNNGVAAYVEQLPDVEPYPMGDLTCALNGEGGVLSTFIQDRPYYTSFHIACLRPKPSLSTAQLLYYCQCIWANRYRYSWGRQANRTLKTITVPTPDKLPQWIWEVDVDRFIGSERPANAIPTISLTDTSVWKRFRLEELFDIRKGKRLTKARMKLGETPFVGAIDSNNGVSAFVAQQAIHDGNTITVNYNGSVAEAFYQPKPFWCSDDVNVLYPKFKLTPAIALFIATVIRLERYRFNYGRKWHLERMRTSEIRLPATDKGDPNWQYMEAYILSLPFSSQVGTTEDSYVAGEEVKEQQKELF